MTGVNQRGNVCRLIPAVLLLLAATPLLADPIVDFHEEPLSQPKTIFAVTVAIFIEAICVFLLLRRWRTPRLFIAWIMGMHLVTYPLFWVLVWLGINLHPGLAVGLAEGAIVVIEGGLIYLMCRYAPTANAQHSPPSALRSVLASLAGNACSAVAFPVLGFFIG
jgi:hypothetical protein